MKRSQFFDQDITNLFSAVKQLGIEYDKSLEIDHLNMAKLLTEYVKTTCPEDCFKIPWSLDNND